MNQKASFSLSFFLLVFFLSSAGYAIETKASKSPEAFMPAVRQEFSPVLEGTEVVRDFIIQNRGNAMLEISRVQTG